MIETTNLEEWLQSVGLSEYATLLTQNHVTLSDLPNLTGDDLKECGIVSLGHRRKLLEAAQQIPANAPAVSDSSPVNPELALADELPEASFVSAGALYIPEDVPVPAAFPGLPSAPVFATAVPRVTSFVSPPARSRSAASGRASLRANSCSSRSSRTCSSVWVPRI